jgi:diacylglycerol O-acyltransferase / wax synthase
MSIETEPLTGIDGLFLSAEREDRHMNIGGMWIFDESLSKAEVMSEFAKLFSRFPRWRQRIIEDVNGNQSWLAMPAEWTGEDHVEEIVLENDDNDDDDEQMSEQKQTALLQDLVGTLYSRLLPKNKPLWRSYLIQLPLGGCCLYTVLHHAVADGQGSVRMVLSMCDSVDGAEHEQHVVQNKTSRVPTVVSASDVVATARHRSSEPVVQRVAAVAGVVLRMLWSIASLVFGVLRMLATLGYIGLYRKRTFAAKRHVAAKDVAWSTAVLLDDVKRVKNALGVTVNDILVSALTSALRKHIINIGQADIMESNLVCAIPVSIRRPDDFEPGNKVSIVNLFLPTSDPDAMSRLRTISHRMNYLKRSVDIPFGYWYFKLVSAFKFLVPPSFQDAFLNKYHAVFTNVPGPKARLVFANRIVRHYYPTVPIPGTGSLGIGILSYADNVVVCIAADQGAPSGSLTESLPRIIARNFVDEFEELMKKVE